MVFRKALFGGAAIIALLPGVAAAQNAPAQQASAEETADRTGQVADIIVTAQRRAENLQNVPIAVTAISGDSLAEKGIASTNDLAAAVPGLLIQKSGQAVTPFLRGVGSQASNPGNDPSIATYVDGIYQSVPFNGIYSLADIERIEVLKGPQGTLFGRNATGGLVNIVTKDPEPGLGGSIRFGVANFETVEAGAYLTGGSDDLAASFSVLYKNQNEGWGRNLAADPGVLAPGIPLPRFSKAGFINEFIASAKIKAQLGDRTTITLAGRYFENKGDQGEYRRGIEGARLAGGYVFPGGFWDEASDVSFYYQSRQYSIAGTLEHEFSFATFKSITSYVDFDSLSSVPSDSTPNLSFTNSVATNLPVQTFTQELQLLSNEGGPLKWIVGAFYLDSKAGYLPTILGNGALLTTLTITGRQKSESIAGFGQFSYDFGQGTTVTGGLRYTQDKFTANQVYEGQVPNFPGFFLFRQGVLSNVVPDQKTTQDAWTYKVAVDHRFSDEVLAYGSYSRGYKAGGFNLGGMCLVAPAALGTCGTIAPPVRPEKLDAYEAGLKTDLFDRRLRLNLAGFYYDYQDLQLQIVTGSPPISLLTNAASAEIYGGELEGQAVLGNLDLNFGVGLLHSEYKSFPNGPIFTPVPAPGGGNVQSPNADLSGNRLSRAPKFTSSVGATYHIPTSFGEVAVSGNYYHNSGFVWEPSNRLRQKSYDLLSGQIEFTFDDMLKLSIWGRNLTNEKYYSYVKIGTDGDQGSPAAPRTYGATLKYDF